MGMDVYGNKPTSEVGKYFRANVWWWRPLANYIQHAAPEIAAKCQYWHSNDGDGLGVKNAKALATRLLETIENGEAEAYVKEYTDRISALPLETCTICNGTGIRTDDVGVKAGWPEMLITEEGHPRHGQKGSCNSCAGRGTVPHWDTYYHLNVDTIREFALFAKDSGGFKIL